MSLNEISPLLRAWYKWKMLRLPWRRQFLVGFDLKGNTYWEFVDRGTPLPASTTSTPASSTAHPDPSSPSSHTSRAVRWRRIVRYPRGTPHDAVAVPPAWHQWLRHTRAHPPSLAEQRADVARQERIKLLAAQADARWEAKPRIAGAGAGVGPGGGAQIPIPSATGSKVMDKAALGVREPATLVGKPNPLGPLGKEDQEQKQKATLEEAGKEKVGGGAGGVSGVVAPDDEIALRNGEVASQRDETWERMRREAEEKEKEARGGGEGGKPDPWKQAARGGPSEAWQPQAWQPSPRPKK